MGTVEKRPRRTFTRSPRAVPWERTLPWAAVSISQTAAADDRGRGFVYAKAVDKNSSRAAGTSVTARIPSACARCAAGKRPSGRHNGVPTTRSKPSTPPPNVRAASVPLRSNHPRLLKLRRRVVTQQKFFCRSRAATGRGAANRPPSRAATRQATAAAPAARRFIVSWIVNASGGSVAPSRAAAPASANTRRRGHAAAAKQRTWTGGRCPSHRRRNRDPRPRRSAVAGLSPPIA
jgi:hypothetical protein